MDLYFHVYMDAGTSDIEAVFSNSPSVSGLDNLVVFSKSDYSGADGDYLDDSYVTWTVLTHQSYQDTVTDVYSDHATSDYPFIFFLRGDGWGSALDTDGTVLTLFFNNLTPLTTDGETVSCQGVGITIGSAGCTYVAGYTTSASWSVVQFSGDSTPASNTIYNLMTYHRLEIPISQPSSDT